MSRNLFIDYLKGIAIFLVAWGHSLQFLDSSYNCFGNYVFLFIYSFHMPLFMCVSGYLFAYGAKKKPVIDMLLAKFKQLIIPVLCWGFIFTWLIYYKELMSMDFLHGFIRYSILYVKGIPYYLWFLWSLFILSILTALYARTKYNEILLHVITFLILLCLPDKVGLSYIKFMYPFFLMGYFYNIYALQLNTYGKYLVPLCFIIFPLCLVNWSKIDLIYFTPMSFFHTNYLEHLYIISLRYLIGFSGVIVIITIIKKFFYFPKITFITTMGVFSLGIYIIQSASNYIFEIYFSLSGTNLYLYTFVYAVIFALLSVLASIYGTKVIGKSPFLGRVLFGGRY